MCHDLRGPLCAIAVVVLSIAMLRRRQKRRCSDAVGGTSASNVALLDGDPRRRCPLPVWVNPTRLTDGWAVAPPIFHPPRLAIVPFVLPLSSSADDLQSADMPRIDDCSVFLVCEGPTSQLPNQSQADLSLQTVFLQQYADRCPLLMSYSGSIRLRRLQEAGLLTDETGGLPPTSAFTHVATCDSVTLLFGCHGPYIVTAVFMGFEGTLELSTPSSIGSRRLNIANMRLSLRSSVEMVVTATEIVPVYTRPDGLGVPLGMPFGAHKGYFRVTCRYDGHEAVLTAPCSMIVRGASTPPPGDGKNFCGSAHHDVIVFFSHVSAFGERLTVGITPALLERIAKDRINIADAFSNSPEWTVASKLTVSIKDKKTSSADGVSIVYVQPYIGATFSVDPQRGVVYDPVLTEHIRVLYYPHGEVRDVPRFPAAAEAEADPPHILLEYITTLPKTWERVVNDEDELIHNVKFHFTEWETTRVTCSHVDLNGVSCIHFTEHKEGRCSRTYVVPRGAHLLVIRWETMESAWDANLASLQTFLDTLHFDSAL